MARPRQKKTRTVERKDGNKGEKRLAEGRSSLPTYHLLFPHSIGISGGMRGDETDKIIHLFKSLFNGRSIGFICAAVIRVCRTVSSSSSLSPLPSSSPHRGSKSSSVIERSKNVIRENTVTRILESKSGNDWKRRLSRVVSSSSHRGR